MPKSCRDRLITAKVRGGVKISDFALRSKGTGKFSKAPNFFLEIFFFGNEKKILVFVHALSIRMIIGEIEEVGFFLCNC